MTKIPIKTLKWRRKQPRGAIMKPKTFQKIKRKAMKKYHIGEKRAEKIAGKAYWTSVKAKASKK
jgi:hypothetical protein